MTKEEKQTIDRAVKESWRTGDRTRLKHLLEKNLKLYCEIEELERENEELKRDKEDLIFVRNAKADHICELKDQLTKATELLKKLILEVRGYEEINGYDTCEPVQEAEQFLNSEVEK